MATKYEEELEKAKLQPEQPKQQKQNALQGMSDTTQQKLATLSQGYTPSQNVTSAQQYLQGIIGNKPGQYNSQYAPQITQLYDKMMNRGQFKYDMNADPLYQQYKNSYMNAGKQAMQDTIGNMSALTGGYGNSYAGAAGQQQYQQYLQGLHDVIPTLQQQAYDRYQQEGKDLQNLLAITQGLDETAYGRHRDTVSDWQADRGFAQGAYESAYDREYQDYLNQLNYWQQQGQMENQDYWTGKEYDLTKEQADRNWQMAQNEFDLNKTQAERDWEQAQMQMKLAQGEFGITERSAAFDQAIAMMQMGMTPGAELLAMAGLTEADMQAYLALIRGSGSGGTKTQTQTTKMAADAAIGGTPVFYEKAKQAEQEAASREVFPAMWVDAVKNGMQNAIKAGSAKEMTTEEKDALVNQFKKELGDEIITFDKYKDKDFRNRNGL